MGKERVESKASPQLENGYTQIANELLEALARVRLSPCEMSMVLTVIRKTYGWHKRLDAIADSQFAEATGISRGNVWRTLARLERKGVLVKVSEGKGRRPTVWALQKDYTKWAGYEMLSAQIAKETGVVLSAQIAKEARSAISTDSHKRNIKKVYAPSQKKQEVHPLFGRGMGMLRQRYEERGWDFDKHSKRQGKGLKKLLEARYDLEKIFACVDAKIDHRSPGNPYWLEYGLKDLPHFLKERGPSSEEELAQIPDLV